MMKACGIALLVLFSTAALGSAQDAATPTSLDRYVGAWSGYATKSTTISGEIDLNSAWMKIVAKKSSPDVIALEGNIWGAKAALKYDKPSSKYLLSWNAEGFPAVADLPLQYSAAEGFAGTTTLSCNGNPCEAKATIKDKGGESEWELVITRGRDKWNMSLTLGKGQ